MQPKNRFTMCTFSMTIKTLLLGLCLTACHENEEAYATTPPLFFHTEEKL